MRADLGRKGKSISRLAVFKIVYLKDWLVVNLMEYIMRNLLTLVLLAVFAFTGCNTAKTGTETAKLRNEEGKNDPNTQEIDVTTGVDLASYLRRIPGVNVRGSGENAAVQIRTQSSFGAVSEPLFVVDGTIIGTSFSKLFSTIDPADIKRVRVLKNASETAEYGLQGGNGVLEFTLKNKK